eukprot:gene56350-11195_t
MGCDVDDVDRGFHPMGLPVGDSVWRYFLGAVVWNPVFIAAILCPFVVAAYAWGTVRSPGIAFIPFLFLLQ